VTGASPAPIARERRHTLYFLEETRATVPVFLDTEVDMSRVARLRERAAASGLRRSTVAYVVYAASRALARYPAANAAIAGRRFPKVARFENVNTKLTLDKTLRGERIVLSAVLPEADRAALGTIQDWIVSLRDADPAEAPQFAGARTLHRLGWPLGPVLMRRGTRPLRRRAAVLGTLAVTSLSHRPVDGFLSVGGTTITLGLGQVAQRPVVRAGEIVAAPVMRLSLTFDHRVVDGALAADLLADIKAALEQFPDAEAADPEESRGALAAPALVSAEARSGDR
jgi:pyruvate/2-oxoglutarate dehydrogenase complex dihydrolipoamide acyltransferase (E2) component